MAATEMVHIRIEKRIKTQAAKTLATMGLVRIRRRTRSTNACSS